MLIIQLMFNQLIVIYYRCLLCSTTRTIQAISTRNQHRLYRFEKKKTSYGFSLILYRIVLLYSCINIMVKSFDVNTRQPSKWFVFN